MSLGADAWPKMFWFWCLLHLVETLYAVAQRCLSGVTLFLHVHLVLTLSDPMPTLSPPNLRSDFGWRYLTALSVLPVLGGVGDYMRNCQLVKQTLEGDLGCGNIMTLRP